MNPPPLLPKVAVQVEGLGKTYRIMASANAPTTFAEAMLSRLSRPFAREPFQMFEALRDVSFTVAPGEVVGIVGRNGAGKSTLLKILSRITPPTQGSALLRGRVGSLLEVGTGFHPELTGRENIYLNGSILGMGRGEVRDAFDAIVDFAQIETFLDTPVKRYSSGMYVRLAFAVAAHLQPEILIVDEVLAVGDAAFQRKCLGKMQEVAGSGRTVLFVSHNMASVRALCSRAILLENGTVARDGATSDVVRTYLEGGGSETDGQAQWGNGAGTPQAMRFTHACILRGDGSPLNGAALDFREPFLVVVHYELARSFPVLRIGWGMQNAEGVFVCGTNEPDWSDRVRPEGIGELRCGFPGHVLNEGRYFVNFCADVPHDSVYHQTDWDLAFSVEDAEGHGTTAQKLPGVVRPAFDWQDAR